MLYMCTITFPNQIQVAVMSMSRNGKKTTSVLARLGKENRCKCQVESNIGAKEYGKVQDTRFTVAQQHLNSPVEKGRL